MEPPLRTLPPPELLPALAEPDEDRPRDCALELDGMTHAAAKAAARRSRLKVFFFMKALVRVRPGILYTGP
ncbi:MAG TPA: hypothetical protein VMT52_03115 [Planctomycetota bacterium]|nr:hypothetical protein [Planctomycetota bacterium]